MTDVQETATKITIGTSLSRCALVIATFPMKLKHILDFLNETQLPDPLALSETARQLLTIREKPTESVLFFYFWSMRTN